MCQWVTSAFRATPCFQVRPYWHRERVAVLLLLARGGGGGRDGMTAPFFDVRGRKQNAEYVHLEGSARAEGSSGQPGVQKERRARARVDAAGTRSGTRMMLA